MAKWKKYSIITGTCVALALTITPFAFKYSQPNSGFKPAVYNYVQYISPKGEQELKKTFSYRTYEDLPEFKKELLDGKTIGGISSDYQIAEFAVQGLIKPINFNWFFGTSEINYDQTWAKNNYADFVFEQMSNYDNYLYTEFIKQGKSEDEASNLSHLWKWTIPYFTQDKVISFNIERLSNLSDQEKQEWLEASPEELNKKFINKSYLGILKQLKELGANKFAINDIFRQNLAIGSTYNSDNNLLNGNNSSGELTLETYKSQTDNFVNIVEKGTGFSIKDNNHIELNGSDADILANLINPNRNDAVGIIYNGDAMQTLFPFTVFDELYNSNLITEKNPVRTIRVSNQISLFDGLVVSSKINSEELEKSMLNSFYKSVYEGNFGVGEFSNGFLESDLNSNNLNGNDISEAINDLTSGENAINEYKKYTSTLGFDNFDFIAYTPVTKYAMNLSLNFYYFDLIESNYKSFTNKKKKFLENWAKQIIQINKVEESSLLQPIVVAPSSNIINSIAFNYYRQKTTS